jgi:chloride channel protein, CIC family
VNEGLFLRAGQRSRVWLQRARIATARVRELSVGLVRRVLPSEAQHLFALTIAVGVVCGLVAVAFHLAIKGAEALLIERALHATGETWMVWTIVTPTLGGLLAGVLLQRVVPGARGSGIPQVKMAFALEGGRVRFRDAFGKFWLAALQIGSGASLGREGPTVQICAGAASALGRLTALPTKNMRRLLPVGVAAGIAAAFNAPIAAVTFTIEEIVGSLDHAVLSGVVVAAALAAVIERSVLGVHPIIEVRQAYGLDHATSLALFAVLGVAGGLVSVGFTDGLLWLRRGFQGWSGLPRWAHPAVGGLVTGVLSVVALRFLGTTGINGGGYETLGKALAGQLGLEVLVALCVLKSVATVFSYSSGGAGGIFAPTLFIGAMLGGTIGYLDVTLLGHEPKQLGAFALVGMGAVFAGVIRAPMTSVLIIFEMTGGYGLVLPLMLANMTSYVLARRLRPLPIYEALLAQDGVVLPSESSRPHVLEQLKVREVMTTAVLSLAPDLAAPEAAAQLAGKTFELVPVVEPSGRLVGVVSVGAVRAAAADLLVRALVQPAETVLGDTPLTRAIVHMNDRARRQLVVLDETTGTKVVGVLTITDVVRAHAQSVGRTLPTEKRFSVEDMANLRAASLMQPAPQLEASSTLEQLVEALATSPAGAVVIAGPGAPRVALLEDLREFLREDQLRGLLIAGDVARAVEVVESDVTFDQVVLGLAEKPAVIVLPGAGERAQVVTRAALGELLFDWYARAARRAG